MTPQRLQLSRKKGFRLPLDAKSVARPSRYGNPFMVWENRGWWAEPFRPELRCKGYALLCKDRDHAHRVVVQAYRHAIDAGWNYAVPTVGQIRAELAGLSLACWCAPEYACHADLLLEIANA